jgi:hypothetical protein
MWKAYTEFLGGDRAKVYTRDFTPAADGTFRLDNVSQGSYQLIGPVRFGSRVVVPPMPGGKSDEPLDLGDLPFHGEPPMKPGAGDVAAADMLSIERIARIDEVMRAKVKERERLRGELDRLGLTLLPQHRKIVQLRQELRSTESDIERYATEFRAKWRAGAALPKAPSVLLVTQDNFFLERAVGALDAASKVVRPADYAPDVAAKFDVVILDRVPPDTRLPPNGRFIWVGPEMPQGLRLKNAPAPDGRPETVKDVTFATSTWKRDHPVLRDLALEKVFVETSAKVVVAKPESEVLVAGNDPAAPLVVLHREGGRTFLVLPFDLLKSNWPLKISFPVFLWQAVDYLSRPEAARAEGV